MLANFILEETISLPYDSIFCSSLSSCVVCIGFISLSAVVATAVGFDSLIGVSLPGGVHAHYYKCQLGGTLDEICKFIEQYAEAVSDTGDALFIIYPKVTLSASVLSVLRNCWTRKHQRFAAFSLITP